MEGQACPQGTPLTGTASMLASSQNLVCLPLLSHAGDQHHQERVRCGAACAPLHSTEIVFRFAGRRVVDWMKIAGKDEPKDEVFWGERAKARVKVSCTRRTS